MLFPELVSPGKYKQVKIGREEIKNIGKNGSILLQLRRTRESTSPVVSTRNPKQNFLSSSNLFSKKTIPLAVHNYIAFTQIAARGWPYYVPRSKDRLPLKELSKIVLVGLDQQTPTLSTHFFISVLYLIINQAGQVQLQPDLNGGPVY